MKRLTILAVCALTLLACASTTMTTSNDADAAIRAATQRFITAFNAGDWASVANYYSDDAVLLMPNTDVTRGRAAIQQSFSSMASLKPNITFGPDRVVQSCDVAYEYGHYQFRMTAPNGSPMNDAGKYLTVWRRMPEAHGKSSPT
jgi:uncharacterized protein (TIGR02246 family)